MKHGGLRFIMGPFLTVPLISRRIQVLLSPGSLAFRTFRTCSWHASCCLHVPKAPHFLLAGSSCPGATSSAHLSHGLGCQVWLWFLSRVPLFVCRDLGARGQWLKRGT